MRLPARGLEVPVDDLVPLLNPLQQVDLMGVLERTPERLRPNVALAWTDITIARWAMEAGVEEVTLTRWLRHQARMPFGGAVRLARVIGVDPVLLFEGYCY